MIDVLTKMLRRLLRPLVRLLLAHQLSYPMLSQILKALYVEVAAEAFPVEGRRSTLSRLSLLTGIHRREVKRLLQAGVSDDAAAPSSVTLGAQILARWTGDARFRDADGRPRPLPRQSGASDAPNASDAVDTSEGPGFSELVRSVSVDIHPRSVLDEWLRLGVARLDEADRVTLVSEAFVPARGFAEKAHFVGRNVRDHLAAAGENLESQTPPFLERSVYYAALPPEAVDELRALARAEGQAVLERVDARARILKQAAAEAADPPRAPLRRFSFGVYEYSAPNDADLDGAPDPANGASNGTGEYASIEEPGGPADAD